MVKKAQVFSEMKPSERKVLMVKAGYGLARTLHDSDTRRRRTDVERVLAAEAKNRRTRDRSFASLRAHFVSQ